jgi:fucose 4-O-acetylase-like acetyltransferase
MPLFYMLSGFFFKSSLKLNLKDFIFKKGIQLVLPWFFWCVLRGTYLIYNTISFHTVNDFVSAFKLMFGEHFWFLRELFISYCLVYLSFKILKKGYLAAIASILFVLVAPIMGKQSFYLPIFFMGIFIKENYRFIANHLNLCFYGIIAIFRTCLIFWDAAYLSVFPQLYSWKTFSFSFAHVPIALFRFLTGISGSIFLLLLFQKIYKKTKITKMLSNYNKYTLEIYITSSNNRNYINKNVQFF